MSQFTAEDGLAIAKKLGITVSTGRGGHDTVKIRFDGKFIGQFGIRRSSHSVGHDYIPHQMYLVQKECRAFRDCTLSVEQYKELLRLRGKL